MVDIKVASGKRKSTKFTPAKTVLIGFLVVILIGSFFLALPISNQNHKWLNYTDALFTSTSAVCVTGLIVVDTATNFTLFGQIVLLILIQIGGLGFMTVATLIFLMMGKKITLKERLAIQESLVQLNMQGMVILIKKIALMTFVIEGAGALILGITFVPSYGFRGVFMSIFHSVSAFCNAGFDILGSVGAPFDGFTIFYDKFMLVMPLMMLIVLGGIGFTVIKDTMETRKWKRLQVHTKVVLSVTGILIVSGFLFYLIAEFNNPKTLGPMKFGDKLLNALFQSISPRTAGFSTIQQADMTWSSKAFTCFLMFIGASPGSTGGGVKTTVLFVILIAVLNNTKGRDKAIINRQEISFSRVLKALTIVVFGAFVVFIGIILLLHNESGNVYGFSFDSYVFEVFSAFGTVGLSYGITPYLSIKSKFLIMFIMYLGRVGPITVGIALTSRFAIATNNKIKYSEAKIMVG